MIQWKTADRAAITGSTLPTGLTNKPWKELATNLALVVIGTALLLAAAQGQKLWYVLLWFSLGMVALAIAFLYLNDWLASQLDDGVPVPASWWWLFGLLTALGLVGLGVSVVFHWPQFICAVSVIAATGGMIGIHVGAGHRDTDPPEPTDPWHRAIGRIAWIGAAAMLVPSLVIPVLPSFGLAGWGLLLVWLAGLIALKLGVAPFLVSRRQQMGATMVAMIVLTAVGGALIGVGVWQSQMLLVLPGVSLVIGALSVLGLALVQWDMPDGWGLGLMLAGIVYTLGGIVWATDALNIDGLGRVVALFVFGIGTWYVFRGEGIVLALMIGWIAVWGLTDRTADVPADPHEGAEIRMLAIGDSFISGEGAGEFLPGTNEANENECRRAATAYSYLVAKGSKYSLDFLACQGAKINDLVTCGQMSDRPRMLALGFDEDELESDRCTKDGVEWTDAQRALAGAGSDEVAGFVPQLEYFAPEVYREYHVVLVSIGGNDAGFSTLVKSCLLPSDCSDQADVWEALALKQHDRLVEFYTYLRSITGDHTRIVAMPYPPIATGEDCQLGLSAAEHEFIDGHIDDLERVIRSAADQAGITFYGETTAAYLGHDLCKGDDAGANHLLVETTEGEWTDRYLPDRWIHGSMHPNETGHLLLARELMDDVQTWAEEVEAKRDAEEPFERGDAPVPDGPAYDEELATEGETLVRAGDWMVDELYDSLRSLIGPLLMLLVSGIAFAAGFLRYENWLSNALRPRE